MIEPLPISAGTRDVEIDVLDCVIVLVWVSLLNASVQQVSHRSQGLPPVALLFMFTTLHKYMGRMCHMVKLLIQVGIKSFLPPSPVAIVFINIIQFCFLWVLLDKPYSGSQLWSSIRDFFFGWFLGLS